MYDAWGKEASLNVHMHDILVSSRFYSKKATVGKHGKEAVSHQLDALC